MAVSATKPPMVEVERDAANPAIALVTLSKEPVNSMNFGLWEGLYNAVDPLNKDKTVRAIIFKSGLKKNVREWKLSVQHGLHRITGDHSQCPSPYRWHSILVIHSV